MTHPPIIYSHGFGTRSDARGLFTDIAAIFPDRHSIQFNYNEIIDDRTLRVSPLEKQVKTLSEVIGRLQLPSNSLDLVAHSQGGAVAALARAKEIRRAIFIAPPPAFDVNRFVARSRERVGAHLDLEGESIMPRSDGSTTLVPAAYWESIRNVDLISAYNDFAQQVELTIIAGNQDDVFADNKFQGLSSSIRLQCIDGDHNFTGEYRGPMLALLKELL